MSDEAHQTTEAVMQRDRRRIRWLAGITIAVWVSVAFLLPALFLPAAAKFKMEVQHLTGPDVPNLLTANDIAKTMLQMRKDAIVASYILMMIALAAEVLAAILTVTLVLTVRRVTLRHVSDQLSEISRQLDELRRR